MAKTSILRSRDIDRVLALCGLEHDILVEWSNARIDPDFDFTQAPCCAGPKNVGFNGNRVTTSRVLYEACGFQVVPGGSIHSLCGNIECVSPLHHVSRHKSNTLLRVLETCEIAGATWASWLAMPKGQFPCHIFSRAVRFEGRTQKASRVLFSLLHNQELAPSWHVKNRCKTPSCVHPSHHELITVMHPHPHPLPMLDVLALDADEDPNDYVGPIYEVGSDLPPEKLAAILGVDVEIILSALVIIRTEA